METFIEVKEFVPNLKFDKQRSKALKKINYKHIDSPIVDIIKRLNELPYFFTLQCCYGHFLYKNQNDEHNLEPIPKSTEFEEIEYRIAYLAFCIQDTVKGTKLLNSLRDLTKIDSENIQFGCANWFWDRQVNSFILQVEPDRFKMYDKAILNFKGALHIETIRDQFYNLLNKISL